MEIKTVFDADPMSTWQVLCQPGEGFYIPAYQREYTWGKSNITRLFDDSVHGLHMLVESNDAITFLGTLIVIHDTKYETVAPHIQGQLPAKVKVVIDGQQRLSTLLLINTCLHEEIRLRARKLDKQESASKWLHQKTVEVTSQLQKTFEQDMDYGEGTLQWYPRMIRAYVDSWSREESTASYSSPIAAYLHEYSAWIREHEAKTYSYKIPDEDSATQNRHKYIVDNRKNIKTLLKKIAKSSDNDLEFPLLESIPDAKHLQLSLMNSEFPDEVNTQLTHPESEQFSELMRLVLFAKFLLHRVAMTTVTAKNEVYAFDMFEALNTTGEPLTAFETFRPIVINTEGLNNYEKSPSRKYMKQVEDLLDEYTTAQSKQRATSKLLVPFALAESGRKLSNRLSDQRIYLRDQFEKIGDQIEEKRLFVHHLAHLAIFIKHGWPDSKDALPDLHNIEYSHKDLTLMGLSVLRDLKHDIAIAPIVRFFSQVRTANSDAMKQASEEFEAVILACIAFFGLWRGSRNTTENIDSYYRELMKDGSESIEVDALSRWKEGTVSGNIKSEDVKKFFRHILKVKGGISSETEWVAKASAVPVYSASSTLTKFLLFVGTHDTTPDAENLGLVQLSREGVLNMLTQELWSTRKFTVEHIAPQSNSSNWVSTIYDNPETIHRLGNLTLLPMKENSSVTNRSWDQKQLIYQILASETVDELESLLEKAQQQGIEFSHSTQDILQAAKYLPQLKAIGQVQGDWTLELIDSRSERIAKILWTRLSPWLGL